MAKIKIPLTLDEADTKLASLGGLITAKEWERAALVSAFTHEGRAGRPKAGNLAGSGQISVSISQFAQRKIQGLSSRETIRHYRGAWDYLVEQGVVELAVPGVSVALPDPERYPFPPNPTVGRNVTDPEEREQIVDNAIEAGMKTGSKALDVASNTRSIEVATKSSTTAAEAAWRGIKANPAVLAKVTEEINSESPVETARRTLADPDLAPDVMRDRETRRNAGRATAKVANETAAAKRRERATEKTPAQLKEEEARRQQAADTTRRIEMKEALTRARRDLNRAISLWNEAGSTFSEEGKANLAEDVRLIVNIAEVLSEAIAGGTTLEAELAAFLSREGGQ